MPRDADELCADFIDVGGGPGCARRSPGGENGVYEGCVGISRRASLGAGLGESGEVVAVRVCRLAEAGDTQKREAHISASHLREPEPSWAFAKGPDVQRG